MKNIMKPIATMLLGGLMLAACGEDTAQTGAGGSVYKINNDALIAIVPKVDDLNTETGFYGDIVYGNADAPITIVEYASLTCSHCGNFHNTIMPKLKAEYFDTGRAKLVYRNFSRDQYDLVAGAVSRCTDAESSKRLLGLFFEKQNDWYRQGVNPMEELAKVARRAGMSRAKFERCAVNTDMNTYLTRARDQARDELQIGLTPTIYVDGVNLAEPTYEGVKAAIEAIE